MNLKSRVDDLEQRLASSAPLQIIIEIREPDGAPQRYRYEGGELVPAELEPAEPLPEDAHPAHRVHSGAPEQAKHPSGHGPA